MYCHLPRVLHKTPTDRLLGCLCLNKCLAALFLCMYVWLRTVEFIVIYMIYRYSIGMIHSSMPYHLWPASCFYSNGSNRYSRNEVSYDIFPSVRLYWWYEDVSLSLQRIFPKPPLFCFRSTRMQPMFNITVVMPCSSSLGHESRLRWKLGMKNSVVNIIFIIPLSTSSLPLRLNYTVLSLAS